MDTQDVSETLPVSIVWIFPPFFTSQESQSQTEDLYRAMCKTPHCMLATSCQAAKLPAACSACRSHPGPTLGMSKCSDKLPKWAFNLSIRWRWVYLMASLILWLPRFSRANWKVFWAEVGPWAAPFCNSACSWDSCSALACNSSVKTSSWVFFFFLATFTPTSLFLSPPFSFKPDLITPSYLPEEEDAIHQNPCIHGPKRCTDGSQH